MHKNTNNKQSKRKGNVAKMPTMVKATTYPPSKRTILTYPSKLVLTESAANTGATYFYRINSVYDPDFTGVGGNALGFTYWNQLYSNYKVRRVVARLSANLSGASSAGLAEVCLVPVANNATLPSNSSTWSLRPGVRSQYLTLAGRQPSSITATWDIPTVLGVTKAQYDDDMDFTGTTSSNPARQAFFAVTLNVCGSATAGSIAYFLYITYEVEWFNPIPLQ
jgi:hypothetical protein